MRRTGRSLTAGSRARRAARGAVPSQATWTSQPRAAPRTYRVRTYGCQMNVHDSERLSGLLEEAGYTLATEDAQADVVVLNTCAVRENADNRLYGNLGQLRPVKDGPPGHADRRRRLSRPEGPRGDRPARAVGRRRLRDAQRGVAARAAQPCAAQRRGAGGDRRVPRGLPLDPAREARLGLLRLGLDQRRAATTPARSASSRRCAARRRTAGPARSWPRSRRWSTRACSR